MTFEPIVFVADDDPDDQLILKTAWKKSNPLYDCVIFKDGQELMDCLNDLCLKVTLEGAALPSLIILDLNMPRKNGFEVLKELQMDSVLNQIPVVVLSTATDPHYVLCCEELGAMECLLKPNTMKDYYSIMEKLGRCCEAM